MPKPYNRIMPGPKAKFFSECFEGGFIGGDWGIDRDLKDDLSGNRHDFNAKCIPLYLSINKDGSKISAGLACGMLWTICRGLQVGDVVLVPDGKGCYAVGTIASDYYYAQDEILPHRRRVRWGERRIARADMTDALRHSTGSIGTCSDVSRYAEEIEALANLIQDADFRRNESVQCEAFALEKHLEEFLVANWKRTEFGKKYDLFRDEDGQIGEQYPTDTGPLDLLAVSRDKKELLVVELKRGRTSDVVVGQILRYMGYVKDMLCEEGQTVRGAIVALEDDQRIRRALSMVDNVSFYRYKIDFRLEKTC